MTKKIDLFDWPFACLCILVHHLSGAIYVSLHGYKNSSLIIRDQRNFQVLKCNQRRLFSSGWGFRYQVSRYFLYFLHHIHKNKNYDMLSYFNLYLFGITNANTIYLTDLFWCRYVWSIIIIYFNFLGK